MTNIIEAIKTEADYDAALVKLEALMGAEPGTPEGSQVAAPAAAIAAYEERAWPIETSDPKAAGA